MPKSIPQCIVLEFPSISTAARSWLNKYFWEIETKIGSDDCIPHEQQQIVRRNSSRIFQETGTNRSLAPKVQAISII